MNGAPCEEIIKREYLEKCASERCEVGQKRITLEKDLIVDEIIHEGSRKAQIKAQEVLDGALDVIKMYK